MIFVAARNEPAIFLMLAEKDLATMRPGRTLFVDDRQTGGMKFTKVIISLHASNEAALEALRQAGHGEALSKAGHIVSPLPREGEAQCDECLGIMPAYQLNHGRCIVCWRNLAIRHMGASN